MHEVVIMRQVAVVGNSCLTMRSLLVLLTICWFMEGRSLSHFVQKEVPQSWRKACFFLRPSSEERLESLVLRLKT